MNRKVLVCIALGLGVIPYADARELRTPWSLQNGYMHSILPRPIECNENNTWNIDAWAGGLHKEANKAFTNHMGTKTDASLSGIIFGQDAFFLSEAFAPGTQFFNNPFADFVLLRPIVTYAENSAYFGFNYERRVGCSKRWRIGVRTVLPFRALKTTLENCCELAEGAVIEDVARYQYDRLINPANGIAQTVNPKSWAYRMDFLNALFMQQAGVLPFEPFINYVSPIRMNNVQITETTNYPVHVVQRDNGTPPPGPFAQVQQVVNALPALNGDGSGLANNARAHFVNANDYTALQANLAQLRQLWLVPTANGVGSPSSLNLREQAQNIGNKIADLIDTVANGAVLDILENNGFTFETNTFVGIGDFDTMFYTDYDFCNGLMEGFVAVRFPTGIKVKDPQKALSIFTTGNNRHFEAKVGGVGVWQPNCWLSIQVDAMFAHAFKGTERVAAPFEGATVKNIGPTVKSDISWNYGVGHVDFTFLIPANQRVGFMAGYEWYVKTKDRVSLKQSQATDFVGNVQPLNAELLEYRTDVIGHKVRTEFFHQGERWEIFGGWTHVFAGKNAPKESDWHIGFIAYF